MSSRRTQPDPDMIEDDDDEVLDYNQRNPNHSSSRWRHQESSSFREEAARQQQQRSHLSHGVAREPDAHGRVNDLADFLNSTRISPDEVEHDGGQHGASGQSGGAGRFKPVIAASADIQKAGGGEGGADSAVPPVHDGAPPDGKDIICGPLLNYRRMEGHRWFGSVLVVVKGGGKTQPFEPTLVLGPAPSRAAEGAPAGAYADDNAGQGGSRGGSTEVTGVCLYSDPRNTFWRFDLAVDVQDVEARWEYTLPGLRFVSKKKPQRNVFNVPARTEAFRIMFHSCNGFSVGTDEDAWSGPALWNDVMRCHAEAPFHVM